MNQIPIKNTIIKYTMYDYKNMRKQMPNVVEKQSTKYEKHIANIPIMIKDKT